MDCRKLEDCYYYLRGNCTNKACAYRHSVSAKSSDIHCDGWRDYTCYDMSCPYRHATQSAIGSCHATQQRGKHNATRMDDTCQAHDDDAIVKFVESKEDNTQAVCKYHLHGKCKKGEKCAYLHSSPCLQESESYDTKPLLPTSADDIQNSTKISGQLLPLNHEKNKADLKRKGVSILEKYSFRKSQKIVDNVKVEGVTECISDSTNVLDS